MKVIDLKHDETVIMPEIDQDLYYLKCLLQKNDILEITDYREPEVKLLTSAPTKQEKVKQTLILHLQDILLDNSKLYISGVINGSKGHRYCVNLFEEFKIMTKLNSIQKQFLKQIKDLKIYEKTICLVFDLNKYFFLDVIASNIFLKSNYEIPKNIDSFNVYFLKAFEMLQTFDAHNIIVISNSIFLKDLRKIFTLKNTYFLETEGYEDVILLRPQSLYKSTQFVNVLDNLNSIKTHKLFEKIIGNKSKLVFGISDVSKHLDANIVSEVYISDIDYPAFIIQLKDYIVPIFLINNFFMSENNLTNICALVKYVINYE